MTNGPQLVLFCGLPGTLKTYLSRRVSEGIGSTYLTTQAAGVLAAGLEAGELQALRYARYERISRIVFALIDMGAQVVVDGGFLSSASRALVFADNDKNRCVVVYCHCHDEEIRRRRLKIRALDFGDPEATSAQSILANGEVETTVEDPISIDLAQGRVSSVLSVDTVSYTAQWHGQPPAPLADSLKSLVETVLAQHATIPLPKRYESQVRSAFDDLASTYEDSTPWRNDPILIKQLQVDLPDKGCRVLDIGTGTGLATAWYAEQGHQVVGIDPSPVMLSRAAKRLTLSVLGAAPPLPFLSDYFELVIARQSLHYSEPSLLIKEAARVLKSGGQFVVSCTVSESDDARGFWRDYKWATQPLRLEVFSEESLGRLLQEADFKLEKRLRYQLKRVETIESLSRRVVAPHNGWPSFLKWVIRLSESEAPLARMTFDGAQLAYTQHWCTIQARKISS
ncbi:MAG TPA: methyltransferase domain-containing protein [Phycisphaerales bacterium]|nr:methyltransferase domain-containing protein [Phycisphaerales bacterium]